ncbi:MAG TPA: alpha/beta hydrolase [Candidatus Nanopelagicales bacterium]
MPSVERYGVRLHYSDSGAGPCVFWHTGGGGDGRMWSLAQHTAALPAYRHLVLDHRGHGRSDRPTRLEEHRIEEYVADVLAVLAHAGVDRAVFVGYSAGATVGCEALVESPGRWAGFVALGWVPVPDESPDDSLDAAAHARAVGMRAAITEMSKLEGEPAPAWFLDNLVETETDMFALLLEAWAPAAARPWDDLPRIDAPTLFLAGSEECSAVDLYAAVARTPAARGVRLPGFGHLQTFWRSDVTAPLVADFVAEAWGNDHRH